MKNDLIISNHFCYNENGDFMGDNDSIKQFDELIGNYIQSINKLMKHRTSNKVLFRLKSEFTSLVMAMSMSGVLVDIPDRFLANLERCNDEVIERKIRDLFVETYDTNFDYNMEIANINDELTAIFGDGYVLDYHKPVSMSETIKFASDFFDYYDKDIKKFYDKKIDDNKLFLVDAVDFPYDGITFPMPSQYDSFILSGYDGTMNSCLTLIHEFIHSYVEEHKNENFDETLKGFVNNLGETYPRFIEYVFMHYLHEINFFDKEIRALEVNNDVTLMGFLDEYKTQLIFLDGLEIYKDDDLFTSFMDTEKYTYGHIVAYHYFQKYLKDPNRVKDNIYEFSLDDGKYDRSYLLNNYGLREREITNPKKLVKDMKRHFNYK